MAKRFIIIGRSCCEYCIKATHLCESQKIYPKCVGGGINFNRLVYNFFLTIQFLESKTIIFIISPPPSNHQRTSPPRGRPPDSGPTWVPTHGGNHRRSRWSRTSRRSRSRRWNRRGRPASNAPRRAPPRTDGSEPRSLQTSRPSATVFCTFLVNLIHESAVPPNQTYSQADVAQSTEQCGEIIRAIQMNCCGCLIFRILVSAAAVATFVSP